MRTRIWITLSLLLGPGVCAAGTYGMRYEVSKDGNVWATSISAPPDSLIKFRVSAYFSDGTKILTADGLGNAIVASRFTGSQKVAGRVDGDVIQNLVRTASTGNPALLTVNNASGVIGTTAVTSFASQLIASLAPFAEAPEFTFQILRGEIRIGPSLEPRVLTIQNNTFGSGATPGLTFYHSASIENKQSAAPTADNTREDQIATITVLGSGCPSPGYESFTGTATAQPAVPAVFTVTSAAGMSYEWYKNGVLLTNTNRYAGLFTSSLKIPQPLPSDAGSYRCRVYSLCFTYSTTFALPLTITCGADLSRDGFVDDSDFQVFVAAYDAFVCSGACAADLNTDGFVDDLDFSLFTVQYDAVLCP